RPAVGAEEVLVAGADGHRPLVLVRALTAELVDRHRTLLSPASHLRDGPAIGNSRRFRDASGDRAVAGRERGGSRVGAGPVPGAEQGLGGSRVGAGPVPGAEQGLGGSRLRAGA